MNLGALLVEIHRLMEQPDANANGIIELLRAHTELAEYEVARFYVAQRSLPEFAARLRSLDPRVRHDTVAAIPLICTRSSAAKLLRSVVKDPDIKTRKRARRAIRELHIADVALRDTRFEVQRSHRPRATTPGAYNPSGWAFGVYGRKPAGFLDRAKLDRHALPELSDRGAVAALIGRSEDSLAALLRPGTSTGSAYVEFEVPKATGGLRRIAAPRAPLRAAQRTLLAKILENVPPHAAAHGFVAGRSTVTNAAAHVGAAIVLKADLVDFFPSVHYRRVLGMFESLGYPPEAASALAGLCTYRPKLADGQIVWPGVLPQGAPTSPAITNIVCRRLDARLFALAAKLGGIYTRYADDLTLSFREEPANIGRLWWWIDQICQQEGFTENTKKRRVLRQSSQQRITGIVVNDHLTVPRRDRRVFRAMLANVKRRGLAAEAAEGQDPADFEAYLHGYAAYVQMVQPELGARFARDLAVALAAGHA